MTDHCTNCRRELGAETKVQPSRVDGKVWCPPCFITRRMGDDPARFNAAQAIAAKCVFCGWLVVSFGARPGAGRYHCSQCSRSGALRVRLEALPFTKTEAETINDAVADARRDAT